MEMNESNLPQQQGQAVEMPKEVPVVAKPVREKRKRPKVQWGPPPREVDHVEQVTVQFRAR